MVLKSVRFKNNLKKNIKYTVLCNLQHFLKNSINIIYIDKLLILLKNKIKYY